MGKGMGGKGGDWRREEGGRRENEKEGGIGEESDGFLFSSSEGTGSRKRGRSKKRWAPTLNPQPSTLNPHSETPSTKH